MQELCRNLQELLTSHGIPDWLVVFIISLCPVLECRLGMFTAIVLLEMNAFAGFAISFLGNILPVPFILLLINWIFKIMKKIPGLRNIVFWLEDKTLKKKDKIDKYGIWGLLFFVAIPLPGTGGWTGALLASLLNLDKKKSFLVITLGVFIAGLIITVLSLIFGAVIF
ncbi:MAG: small multi-drug export protein [Acetobacter sp.]|nr:small multi-drug export protein [Bacteroides sp.]MCM1340409.1 small multi-drug export protein [Acetobacter sp.]MCM1432944.1 small multi-drug export protein [Clostridiales bacterium]